MRVVYTDEYLEEVFGGLSNSLIDPEANIWSQKPESVKIQNFKILEWGVLVYNDHNKRERADVWRARAPLRLPSKSNHNCARRLRASLSRERRFLKNVWKNLENGRRDQKPAHDGQHNPGQGTRVSGKEARHYVQA